MFYIAIAHLVDVKRKLGDFADWRNLGLNLGLLGTKLELIEGDHRSISERLTTVLSEWLKMNYDTTKFGLPTWGRLASAVDPLNHGLAMAIKPHHQ